VEGSCESGNEPSGSIKCSKFLEWFALTAASRVVLSFMKLVYFNCF
jgi:hypothetical protein